MKKLRLAFPTGSLAGLLIAASCSANTPGITDLECRALRTDALARAERNLAEEQAQVSGALGACLGQAAELACINGDRPMPMQSVVKLLVAIAVFDRVDAGQIKLEEPVPVRPEDLSVEVQPLASLVRKQGMARFTVLDLVRRMVAESDSAATDILIAKLGGPKAIEALVKRHVPEGIRVDRYERELQSELSGLVWQPKFSDPAVFAAARSAVPNERRLAAQAAAATDPRDRATPRALAMLLGQLAEGELLKPDSTRQLIAIMEQTRTFPDRLRAGVPPGWRVAHKTGTSRTVAGITATTADVGILTAPDGARVVAAALLTDSRDTAGVRARTIADVAAIAQQYRAQLATKPDCLRSSN